MSLAFRSASCLAIFTLTLPVLVSTASAGSFHKSTTAGHRVEIARHSSWDKDCVGHAGQITITSQASHGIISLSTGTVRVSRVEVGTSCMGRVVPATIVFYTPERAFRGSDQFTYTSTAESGEPIDHQATVDVR